MATYYDVYMTKDDGDAGNEARFVRDQGCNGQSHVDDINKVWFGDDGGVEHAEPVRTEEKGPCDGSCGRPFKSLGFFGYTSSAITA